MKVSILPIATLLLFCSCGTAAHYSQAASDEINIGYGTIDSEKNTYSVSRLKSDDKTTTVYSNMYDYLRGRVPGVTVTANNFIMIRGLNSNNPTEPLILVDGVEVTNLDSIVPSTVSSVEVLKDGSASIYGVRGGNGVILITTKK